MECIINKTTMYLANELMRYYNISLIEAYSMLFSDFNLNEIYAFVCLYRWLNGNSEQEAMLPEHNSD